MFGSQSRAVIPEHAGTHRNGSPLGNPHPGMVVSRESGRDGAGQFEFCTSPDADSPLFDKFLPRDTLYGNLFQERPNWK